MPRRLPPVLLVIAVGALVVSYISYTYSLIAELRAHSQRNSVLFAQISSAVNDTTVTSTPDGVVTTLFKLQQQVTAMQVPSVLTDSTGKPVACINLSFCEPLDSARAREAATRFDNSNAPVAVPGGQVHFGFPPAVDALRIAPFVQAAALMLVLVAGFFLLRDRARAQREVLWAGMARESAHQIATPLSSLNGWLELLSEHAGDPMTERAHTHMRSDLERLERVAHRFERIGRPSRKEKVDVGELARSVADYFRARVPTLAHRVTLEYKAPDAPAVVEGDAVLLEWALEAVVKNAIDALAGRDGLVEIQVQNVPEGGARVRIADNGPGVKREHRSAIFEPGFSTKAHGWGVGLALTRRIIEESHGGELTLLSGDSGATFEIVLH